MQQVDTPAATADYLGVPEKTLTAWRYLGRGPKFMKVGRYVRYRRADVDAWLDQQTIKPGAA